MTTKSPKFSQKAAERRIEKVYRARCNGVGISVLDIGKVFKVGIESIKVGDNDEVLGDKIAAFVETIRQS